MMHRGLRTLFGRPGAEVPTGLAIRCVQGVVVPLSLVLVWHWSVISGLVPGTLIAPPLDVLTRFVRLLADGTLLNHAVASLVRILCGYAIGMTLGIALGALIGTSRLGSRFLEPTALTLIPMPAVAWIPLLVILLGIGETSKIVLVAIGSFSTLVIATSAGVRNASKELVEVADVFEKSRFDLFLHILLPAAIPNIVSAARVAMALSWTLLVAAEVIASADGLGWLIWDSRNFARPDVMISGMVAIGILGKCTDLAIYRLGLYLTRWDEVYR